MHKHKGKASDLDSEVTLLQGCNKGCRRLRWRLTYRTATNRCSRFPPLPTRRAGHVRRPAAVSADAGLCASGTGHASLGMFVASCLGWPSDLLKFDCAKGELLVAGGFAPPPIMGVLPELDASMLTLHVLRDGEEESEELMSEDDSVAVGDAVELRWIATRHPPLSTHLVFISSSGAIAGGQPCGPNGASLHCTTCGEEPGWLNRVVWNATAPGVARLAVGAARGGFGTPAVRVAIRHLTVVASDGDGSSQSRTHRVADSCLGDGGTERRVVDPPTLEPSKVVSVSSALL